MEEKTQPKKLSYDELKANFSELYQQYQRLVQEYQKAMVALQDQDFNHMSFLLQMLFKVLEHPEHYTEEFVSWCSEHIESALMEFAKPDDAAISDLIDKKDEAE